MILPASVTVGGGGWGWGGARAVTESKNDTGSGCCEHSGIIAAPFCRLMFLFPPSFAHLLQVQKRTDTQRSCHPRGLSFTEGVPRLLGDFHFHSLLI